MSLYKLYRLRKMVQQLEQKIEAMPEYTIYRVVGVGYCIYVEGQERFFANESEAQIAQLAARGNWLRIHSAARCEVILTSRHHTYSMRLNPTRQYSKMQSADTRLQNAHGCPFVNQTGADAIRGFERLLATLSPKERAAFEHERRIREHEKEEFKDS